MKLSRWKTAIALIVGMAVIGIGLAWLLSALRVPPIALTKTRFTLIKLRIEAYYKANHRLPSDLQQLPERPGYDNEIVDGWKRPIRYTANDMRVALLSLGKDGQPGGSDEDADIQITFAVGDTASGPATQP